MTIAEEPDDPRPEGLSREYVARFLLENEAKIRELARQKLGNTRGPQDSEDVFASVTRRFDQLASGKGVRPRSAAELWALVRIVTQNTAIEKVRLVARMRALTDVEGEYARRMADRFESCESDEEATLLVQRMAMTMSSADDRQIFFLNLRGASDQAIATAMRMTKEAASKRRRRLWHSLEERFHD